MADFGAAAAADYSSELEPTPRLKRSRFDLAQPKAASRASASIPSKRTFVDQIDQAERSRHHRTAGANAYERHKEFMNNYVLWYGKGVGPKPAEKNDFDVIEENHQFVWDPTEDTELTWEKRLAKKYHDKLFKVTRHRMQAHSTPESLEHSEGRMERGGRKADREDGRRTTDKRRRRQPLIVHRG
eukprot:m.137362 g.137362  ORF g.137362 m.137362 type:complete len:185 (+) comp16994_c2_seq2:84-638(+)